MVDLYESLDLLDLRVVVLVLLGVIAIFVAYFILARQKQVKLSTRSQIEFERLLREFELSYGLLKVEKFSTLVDRMQTVWSEYYQAGVVIEGDPKDRLENSLLQYFKIRSTQQSIDLPKFMKLASEVLRERDRYHDCVIDPYKVLRLMIKELSLKDKLDIIESDPAELKTETGIFILKVLAENTPGLKKTFVPEESFIPHERDKVETGVFELEETN